MLKSALACSRTRIVNTGKANRRINERPMHEAHNDYKRDARPVTNSSAMRFMNSIQKQSTRPQAMGTDAQLGTNIPMQLIQLFRRRVVLGQRPKFNL